MADGGKGMSLTPLSAKARLSETGLNTDYNPSNLNASSGRLPRWRFPMFHPLSRWRLYYEVILLTSAIVTGFLIPVEVAWGPDTGDGWKIFFLTMDMYFLLDTILNFRLGYVISYSSIPGGPQKPGMTAVEMAPRKVAQRYLRTWFLPDLLGSLPYDLIGWNSDKRAEGVKLLGLLRVFKVMRLNRMQRFFRWDPAGFMYVAGKVGISSLWMLLFTHFSACMFYYVARLQPPNPDGAWIYGQMVTNDNMAVPISEGTPPQQYISALYFAFIAITSVGFGDVHPGNTVPERIWVSVQITVGNFIMAYVLAEITSLMLDAHARDRLAFLRTAALQDFFKAQANMPDWLQRRITEHYDKRWGSKETEVLEQEITETMPVRERRT